MVGKQFLCPFLEGQVECLLGSSPAGKCLLLQGQEGLGPALPPSCCPLGWGSRGGWGEDVPNSPACCSGRLWLGCSVLLARLSECGGCQPLCLWSSAFSWGFIPSLGYCPCLGGRCHCLVGLAYPLRCWVMGWQYLSGAVCAWL